MHNGRGAVQPHQNPSARTHNSSWKLLRRCCCWGGTLRRRKRWRRRRRRLNGSGSYTNMAEYHRQISVCLPACLLACYHPSASHSASQPTDYIIPIYYCYCWPRLCTFHAYILCAPHSHLYSCVSNYITFYILMYILCASTLAIPFFVSAPACLPILLAITIHSSSTSSSSTAWLDRFRVCENYTHLYFLLVIRMTCFPVMVVASERASEQTSYDDLGEVKSFVRGVRSTASWLLSFAMAINRRQAAAAATTNL